jgi:flavin reductase (DIM6/NTAB) family NADH-FMN oxidoreductase RutF
MPLERPEFFAIMASFASGVTVVTTTHNGRPSGLTVSAFASLSADPMLVLISIDRRVINHDILQVSGGFAVNILTEHQVDMSTRFASKVDDKFAGLSYRLGVHGQPLLEDTLGFVECRTVGHFPGGDHTIFVGEVLDGGAREGRPLLYFRRNYHTLGEV